MIIAILIVNAENATMQNAPQYSALLRYFCVMGPPVSLSLKKRHSTNADIINWSTVEGSTAPVECCCQCGSTTLKNTVKHHWVTLS